jgi:signal transduction histidine kinase
MKEALQSGVAAFQPRARLLKLIGAELISDDVLAITELVKNAHDADAASVTVQFRSVTSGDGEITISDDGHGMNLETLLTRWMEPAGSSKVGVGRRVTKRGRRMLGEKGVGRFAADKLARYLELSSTVKGDANGIHANFDWDAFDDEALMLSDVTSRWEIRRGGAASTHGTVLRLKGLRSVWNERMFRRLCTRLSRLRSPFQDLDDFRICIDSDEFPEYSGELREDFLGKAPHRVDASFDGGDTIAVAVNGGRSVSHRWNGSRELSCGPMRIRIFAFDLETEAVARIGPRMEVRAWLKEWSGVSVYRDGFRVWPYGEPHDDWLRLDQRRVNNPVVRLSNNQVVGFVEIGRDRNPDLVDQTNREGLVNNPALEDLRRLLYFVLQLLETERQSLRHPTEKSTHSSTSSLKKAEPHDIIPEMLTKIAQRTSSEVAADLHRISERVKETAIHSQARQKRLVDGYAELAALGQAAMGVSGAVHPQLHGALARLQRLKKSSKDSTIRAELDEIESSVQSALDRIWLLFPMESGGGFRRRALDVPSELCEFQASMKAMLSVSGTEMIVQTPKAGVLRIEMRPETLHRLLYILAANSVSWLANTRKPEIRLSASMRDGRCEIIFADNGPGIPDGLAEKVFEPQFTRRENALGMGLTIAREIVTTHGGTIEALTDGRRKGAAIRIMLPVKRSRATT